MFMRGGKGGQRGAKKRECVYTTKGGAVQQCQRGGGSWGEGGRAQAARMQRNREGRRGEESAGRGGVAVR